jgi:hypothetical protein
MGMIAGCGKNAKTPVDEVNFGRELPIESVHLMAAATGLLVTIGGRRSR